MADEIVNRLGFSVEDALRELQRLDSALQTSGTAFQTFGEKINAWNSQSEDALSRMRDMASAATRLANSMAKMGEGAAAPAAHVAAPASKLWLPPGTSEEAQKAAQTMQSLGETASRVGDKMREAGEKGTKAGKDAGGAADEAAAKTRAWTVSWETLTRVVVTQMIVRVMSQIRDVLREAVDEALKFSTRISEIQTIAPKIDRNFQGLSKEVANLSKEFNFPLPDVAEAVYQTLSNQFTSAAQRQDIMTAAAKLAKVGVMDLNDAVLLLTGTLNGYGMQSSQAETVAARFAKAIELGRLRGAELTPVIGRIVPLASELGVNLDELNSAMVGLTIGAARVPEAATSFRSAMAALIKPSQDLQKELHNLGFESGPAMVAALGIQGTLLKLKDSTNDDVAAMAKLIRNIRGLNAESRLAGEGAEKVAEAMKAMTDVALPGDFEDKFKLFTSSEAQQYMAEWNRFKVTMATEVGPELIKFVSQLLNAAGGADGLAAAIKGISAALTSLAEPLAIAAGAMAFFSLRAKLLPLNKGLFGNVFNNVVAPVTMATWAVDYLDSRLASMLDNANEKFDKDVKAIVEKEQKAAQARIDAEKKVADENLRLMNQRIAEEQRAQNAIVDGVREKDKELVASSRVTMQAMVATREKVVQQFRAAAQDANKAAEDSMKRQAETQGKLDDMLFKKELEERQKYNDYYKQADVLASLYGEHALDLAKQAATKLTGAETPDQERAAQAIFQRAAAYAQEANEIGKGLQYEWLRKDAAYTVEAVIRKQIAAEKELQANSAARAATAAKAAADEQERVDRMKVLMKEILTDLDLFDKKGPVDAKKSAALSEDLKQRMAAFKKEWMEGTNFDLGEALKFDQLQKRVKTALEGGVSEAEVQRLFAAPAAIDDFRRQIEGGLTPVNVAVLLPVASADFAARLIGDLPLRERLEQEKRLRDEYQKQAELVRKLMDDQSKIAAAEINRKAALGGMSANLEAFNKAMKDYWSIYLVEAAGKAKGAIFGGGNIAEETKALGALMQQFSQLSETGGKGFGPEQYAALQKQAMEVFALPTTTDFDKQFIQWQMSRMKQLLDAQEALKKLQQTPEGQPRDIEAELQKARQEADRTKGIMDQLKPQAATEMGEGAKAAQNALGAIPSMADLAGNIQAAATAMWELAQASWSVQSPPEMTARSGGTAWSFLAFGGRPQGSDVIPAMLSPGEVVINAASARRFSAQLTAINAGVQPVYRSEGGSVTNIGDINVTVSGGGTSRQTARAIAGELRRELRRGTATL